MKHDTLRRFSYIETQLYWGNGLTAEGLGKAFGIARQNAQNVISQYRLRYPESMVYDNHQRRQVRTENFLPRHIRTDLHRFLDYQRGVAMIGHYHAEDDWADLPFLDVQRYVRPRLHTEALQLVLAALRHQQVVGIYYGSRSGKRYRNISPHHLVFADGRYHVRAYCHKKQHYLDFVLTRILAAEPVQNSSKEWVSDQGDEAWKRHVNLEFQLNPDLPDEFRESLRSEHDLTDAGRLVIKGVKEALSTYIDRQMTSPHWEIKKPLWIRLESAVA